MDYLIEEKKHRGKEGVIDDYEIPSCCLRITDIKKHVQGAVFNAKRQRSAIDILDGLDEYASTITCISRA